MSVCQRTRKLVSIPNSCFYSSLAPAILNFLPKFSPLCLCAAFLQKAPEFGIHFLTTLPLTETLLKALQQGLAPMKSADAITVLILKKWFRGNRKLRTIPPLQADSFQNCSRFFDEKCWCHDAPSVLIRLKRWRGNGRLPPCLPRKPTIYRKTLV